MQKKIKINDREINYFIKSSPLAKSIRVIIHHNGKVVVTKPKKVSQEFALKFLISQANFLFQKLDDLFIINSQLLGTSTANSSNNNLLFTENYKKNKNKAKKIINERLDYFNNYYNFRYGKISIRNQTTRWGSCSRQGNLNFNYRLLFLPSKLRDYVVVHELCHLKELNHSLSFWRLVSETISDYKIRRKQLKSYL